MRSSETVTAFSLKNGGETNDESTVNAHGLYPSDPPAVGIEPVMMPMATMFENHNMGHAQHINAPSIPASDGQIYAPEAAADPSGLMSSGLETSDQTLPAWGIAVPEMNGTTTLANANSVPEIPGRNLTDSHFYTKIPLYVLPPIPFSLKHANTS